MTGVFLLVLSGAGAFVWFYWLAPMRHLSDDQWCKVHSRGQWWIETQKQIRRTGPDHDSSISLGRYGDKVWTGWVIRELNSREPSAGSCGEWPYHLDSAICYLTNQRMTNSAARLQWWELNKDKSQMDWIREGFSKVGLVLTEPLTTNNIIDLLKLTHSSTNFTMLTNPIPVELWLALRYNAFRWLSYSGFWPLNLDLNTVDPKIRNEVEVALIRYAQWLGENWDSPGRLPIHEHQDPGFTSFLSSRRLCWTVYGLLTISSISGFWLVRRHGFYK